MDKVIDIEERIPSMRKKRRRKTNRKFLFILSIFIFALLVILYFQSPLSKTDEINVSGASLYSSEQYVEKSGIAKGDSFWNIDIKQAEKSLNAFESVQDVTISRKWYRDIEIQVTEWKPVAYLFNGSNYSLLLSNGEIFAGENITEIEAPIMMRFDDASIRKEMASQLLHMNDNVRDVVSEIIYTGTDTNPEQIVAYMDDGHEVRAIISTFAEKMNYYPKVTAQLQDREKGVIDMEVGTYFIPFSEVYGQKTEGEENDKENE